MVATPTSSTAVCNVGKVNVSSAGGRTAKYNTTNLIKHIQTHRAEEHAEVLQLNKTRGAAGRTVQKLQGPKVSDRKLESIGSDTESFRIHCFRCSAVEVEGSCHLLEHLEPRCSLRPGHSLLSTTQQIGFWYQQIHKAKASISGLKKSDWCIPSLNEN